jgi:sialate O-acetylesterase
MATRMAAWYQRNDPGSKTGGEWYRPTLNSPTWRTMKLPGYWEQSGLPDFDGVVWFRKEIELTPDQAKQPAVLHLGPIDDRDTTWVNGVKVGGLDAYNQPRNYQVPAGVLVAGRNVIAVRVLDTGGNGGIYGQPNEMSLSLGSEGLSLAGSWSYQIGFSLDKGTPVPQLIAGNPNYPTVLYNAMIAPLIPYGIRGAIWYQGESNASRAFQYRALLRNMIADWRGRWSEGSFPFLIVQLANFMAPDPQPADSAWAELREAQSLAAANVQNTGLAVAIDIGDAADIHPKNKQEVGRRLALSALAQTYGQKIEYSGPVYRFMKVEGDHVRLKFTHTEGGLGLRNGDKLRGFAIANGDRKFVWADAVIDGDSVIVSAPSVNHPDAVRYDWGNNPDGNLCNKAGLPASPFRTDNFTGITVNAR